MTAILLVALLAGGQVEADQAADAPFPEIRFQLNGHDAVLMRFGLKAEVVIALLTKENDHWRIVSQR